MNQAFLEEDDFWKQYKHFLEERDITLELPDVAGNRISPYDIYKFGRKLGGFVGMRKSPGRFEKLAIALNLPPRYAKYCRELYDSFFREFENIAHGEQEPPRGEKDTSASFRRNRNHIRVTNLSQPTPIESVQPLRSIEKLLAQHLSLLPENADGVQNDIMLGYSSSEELAAYSKAPSPFQFIRPTPYPHKTRDLITTHKNRKRLLRRAFELQSIDTKPLSIFLTLRKNLSTIDREKCLTKAAELFRINVEHCIKENVPFPLLQNVLLCGLLFPLLKECLEGSTSKGDWRSDIQALESISMTLMYLLQRGGFLSSEVLALREGLEKKTERQDCPIEINDSSDEGEITAGEEGDLEEPDEEDSDEKVLGNFKTDLYLPYVCKERAAVMLENDQREYRANGLGILLDSIASATRQLGICYQKSYFQEPQDANAEGLQQLRSIFTSNLYKQVHEKGGTAANQQAGEEKAENVFVKELEGVCQKAEGVYIKSIDNIMGALGSIVQIVFEEIMSAPTLSKYAKRYLLKVYRLGDVLQSVLHILPSYLLQKSTQVFLEVEREKLLAHLMAGEGNNEKGYKSTLKLTLSCLLKRSLQLEELTIQGLYSVRSFLNLIPLIPMASGEEEKEKKLIPLEVITYLSVAINVLSMKNKFKELSTLAVAAGKVVLFLLEKYGSSILDGLKEICGDGLSEEDLKWSLIGTSKILFAEKAFLLFDPQYRIISQEAMPNEWLFPLWIFRCLKRYCPFLNLEFFLDGLSQSIPMTEAAIIAAQL